MPFGSVTLVPGVNVEQTPTLLTASFASSSLIRFRDGLVQKMGGFTAFIGTTVPGKPRDLHAWQDLNGNDHLAIGSTNALKVVTNGTMIDITPTTFSSSFTPNFSATNGTTVLTVTDPNLTGLLPLGTIVFPLTPLSIGTQSFLSFGHVLATANTTIGTYQLSIPGFAGTAISTGATPVFTTVSGSPLVKVTATAKSVSTTDVVDFRITASGNGVSFLGRYPVASVADANHFYLVSASIATASGSFSMNNGSALLEYFLAGQLASGYQTGTPITATDWTLDNWGEILLACAPNSPVFQYQFNAGYTNAEYVPSATSALPFSNGGIFVSTTQQILVIWGAAQVAAMGAYRNPLLVIWSDSGDYTNVTPSSTNQAGSYQIPSGSGIVGGIATPNQNLIWTDEDCWAMNYIGPPFVFGFNKIGAGAGLISSHAAQSLRGNVYWMGQSNFFAMTSGGLSVMPCPVWDFVFQNLNSSFVANVRSMPNTPFNEVGWLFPSNNSTTGECDCYVKMNITEPGNPWDCGPSNALQRSAWIDQSVFGNPISADASGNIWQQEIGNDAGPSAMTASFTTGYFFIAEGEDFCFVDQVIPDFIWGDYGAAQNATLNLTFNVVNFPGDTPQSFGPYAVTKTTQYINVRFRGRQVSVTVQSSDAGSFWRLGRIRYRYRASGRR